MDNSPRRTARNQSLPPEEVALLKYFYQSPDTKKEFFDRCRALYDVGWPLRSISDAVAPGRNRSTVRSWVEKSPKGITPEIPVPLPYIPTPVVSEPKAPSPGISAADVDEIERLAPIARRFRSKMDPEHAASRANRELTEIVTRLHDTHVTVSELADAAGVTYRAMARRLGK